MPGMEAASGLRDSPCGSVFYSPPEFFKSRRSVPCIIFSAVRQDDTDKLR
jgi:hypothetical protein